ncbi:MAG: uroporphyrinogen-III C-methyltransferase [Pseudohongiella sp.]|nr:uroporphyrinogen-III C-methyltransferase [Pseudohongiella sp.]
MTESAETPKILEELSRSNTATAGSRSSRQQRTARRRIVIVVILFLPVVAGVVFLGYQQLSLRSQLGALQLENQQLDQTLSQQNSALQQLRQDQLAIPQSLEVDDSIVRELEVRVNQEFSQLTQRISELQDQQLQDRQLLGAVQSDQEWKILEAEYLLGIAKQKLQLENDVDTAVVLLEQADQALLASDNRNIFAVRQAIASDLLMLKSVETLDREGIYLRVDNLLTQIDTIDLVASMRQNFQSRADEEAEAVQLKSGTASIIDSSLEFLGSIFVWRKWDETPQAMLAPGQDALIKQSLQLMLGQAQLALLMADNSLYQQSLSKSKDWIQRYAVIDSTAGQALARELDQLMAIDIDPSMPSINQSLSLISQLVASER